MKLSRSFTLLILSLVLIGGFLIYKSLNPSSPNLDKLENLVRDRAIKNWNEEERNVLINPIKNAYFGDLHVHTKYSFDAFIGGVSAGPDEAYRFAKGEEVDVLDKKVENPEAFGFCSCHGPFGISG